ncbi:MAG: hypothetical protein ACOH2M_29995 [Cypionkella sp.]
MNKFVTITVIAGLASVLSTLVCSAAVVAPRAPRVAPHEHQAECSTDMGHMRSVTRADIQTIGRDQRIVLVPVCEVEGVHTRYEDNGTLFRDGNVNTLRQPIARNPALISVLESKDYDEQDVISLRFGGNNSVILYVHQRETN